jgi:PKD repeat protein
MINMKKLIYLSVCILLVTVSCTKKPVADFSYPSLTKVGEYIPFSNLSENADQFLWDFDDGSTSTLSDPSHTFTIPGSYTVSLEAIGEKELSIVSKELQITGITYSFRNNTSVNLPTFYSFYWDGRDILDLLAHGELSIGEETGIVVTDRTSVWFGIIIGDITFVSDEFPLTLNKHNRIIITDNTPIYGGKGPSVLDAGVISEFEAKIKETQIK